MHWSEAEYGEKLKIGGGKERMASLLTDEFVAANGLPVRPRGPAGDARRLAPPQDRALQGDRRGRAARRRGPGSRGSSTKRSDAGWTAGGRLDLGARSRSGPCSSTRSAQANAARFSVFAGDVCRPRSPTRRSTRWRWSGSGSRPGRRDRDRGLAQRPAGRGRRRAALRRDGARATPPTRTSARPCWSSPASGIPASPPRVLANRGAADPGELVTLADLDACRTQPLLHKEAV